MRIVAGRFKGRAITVPSGTSVRPTADRVRQAVFNVLEHGAPDVELAGARVVDLFAGSGALGLEALSRGAESAVFVETAAASRAAIRANIEAFGVGGVTKLLKRDATDLGPATPATSGCTLAFLDPPYGKGLAPLALAELGNHGWLADGAVAVIEEDASATIVLPESFEEIDSRTYGGTRVTFARWTATRA
jgi:16S rRNA (guanine966-N2)-methyltransferase